MKVLFNIQYFFYHRSKHLLNQLSASRAFQECKSVARSTMVWEILRHQTKLTKSAFTFGVRDSSVESSNTMLII